jgi:hypothetical protein
MVASRLAFTALVLGFAVSEHLLGGNHRCQHPVSPQNYYEFVYFWQNLFGGRGELNRMLTCCWQTENPQWAITRRRSSIAVSLFLVSLRLVNHNHDFG